jgi:hypothetical protein
MYKQLTKLTMSRLPAGVLTMVFVIYINRLVKRGVNSTFKKVFLTGD